MPKPRDAWPHARHIWISLRAYQAIRQAHLHPNTSDRHPGHVRADLSSWQFVGRHFTRALAQTRWDSLRARHRLLNRCLPLLREHNLGHEIDLDLWVTRRHRWATGRCFVNRQFQLVTISSDRKASLLQCYTVYYDDDCQQKLRRGILPRVPKDHWLSRFTVKNRERRPITALKEPRRTEKWKVKLAFSGDHRRARVWDCGLHAQDRNWVPKVIKYPDFYLGKAASRMPESKCGWLEPRNLFEDSGLS